MIHRRTACVVVATDILLLDLKALELSEDWSMKMEKSSHGKDDCQAPLLRRGSPLPQIATCAPRSPSTTTNKQQTRESVQLTRNQPNLINQRSAE